MTDPTHHDPVDPADPADDDEHGADYWTPERMRDAVPMPLPADDRHQPRHPEKPRKKPAKKTRGQADSRPSHQPADDPDTTRD